MALELAGVGERNILRRVVGIVQPRTADNGGWFAEYFRRVCSWVAVDDVGGGNIRGRTRLLLCYSCTGKQTKVPEELGRRGLSRG